MDYESNEAGKLTPATSQMLLLFLCCVVLLLLLTLPEHLAAIQPISFVFPTAVWPIKL